MFRAVDGIVESRSPFGKAALFRTDIRAFVGNVIDEPHKGVQCS